MDTKIKVRLRLVIIKNEKLLAYYDSIEDYYFYIGGKLEFGETIEEGWTRDINKFEETEGRPDSEFEGKKWPTCQRNFEKYRLWQKTI